MGILVPLVLLWCRRCGQHFAICRSCYRGHVYCSKECSKAARRDSIRAAQREYRRSDEARLDHLEHERERRRWLRAERLARVGDHTSHGPAPTGTMLPFPSPAVHEAMEVNSEDTSVGVTERNEVKAELPPAATHGPMLLPRKAKHRCAICGRQGYLVETFPEKLSHQHSPRRNPVLRS